MSESSNGKKNLWLTVFVIPFATAIIALINSPDEPWWFGKRMPIRINSDEGLFKTTSPNQKTKTSNPSTDISEPLEKESTPEPNNSIEKVDVYSVRADNENESSSSYSALNITDGNVKSYWKTKRGLILDVALDFSFDEPKSLSQIDIYSPKDGGSYTQPVEIELVFLDDSGEEITSQTIMRKGSSDDWQEYELEKKVDNVISVKMEIGELKNNTASYIALNEVRFYGYE